MPKLTLNNLIDAFSKKPEDVLAYFKSLGVVLNDDWEEYFEKFGKDAFKIAGINNAQNLMTAKAIIEEAIENGTSHNKLIDELLNELALRDWHARLVVNQNISNAYNAGRYYLQLEDEDDFPYLRPITVHDKKTTSSCDWLGKQNIVFKKSDPLLKLMYPPRHFNCRTYFDEIMESQKERLGYTVKNIKDIPEQYLNDEKFRKLPSDEFKPDLSNFPPKLRIKIK
jgi:uncharacterized protein with gpF-like domain